MKKVIEIIYAFITVLSFTIHSAGQLPSADVSIKSPNVATLGQFGEIPVSYFTGTPYIEIPLYEFAMGSYSFPITLAYHPSGIRPEQRPGWTGVGWNLIAGGSVSRTQNGKPDEVVVIYSNINDLKYYAGYKHHYQDFASDNWNTADFFNNYIDKIKDVLTSGYDTEPDRFDFNFLGYSGCFYLDHTGNWQIKSKDILKVKSAFMGKVPFKLSGHLDQSSGSLQPEVITGFIIIDQNGTEYTFGEDFDAVEMSVDFFNQNESTWTSSGWYLSKIKYPNGDEVNLTYERHEFTNQLWYTTYLFSVKTGGNGFFEEKPINECVDGQLISPVFLKQIDFPSGVIEFISSNKTQIEYGTSFYKQSYKESQMHLMFNYIYSGIKEEDKVFNSDEINQAFRERIRTRNLDRIIVKDNKGNILSGINFTYSIETNNRKFLDKIRIGDKSYSFEYYDRDKMPSYLSREVDHWGYYDGRKSDVIFIKENYFNSREPDAEAMKCGVLTKITYPTGGYTRLEFESHRCGKILNPERNGIYASDNRLVSGLRIKRIISSATGNAEDEITENEYFYVADYVSSRGNSNVSSGILGGLPQYYRENYKIKSYSDPEIEQVLSIFCTPASVFTGGNNSSGSHIGYSEVAEVMYNGSINVYKYSNFDTPAFDEAAEQMLIFQRTEYAKYNSREQERGLLLEKSSYDDDFRSTKKETFCYEPLDTSKYVRAMNTNANQALDITFIEAVLYKIYTDIPALSKKTEETYEPGSPVPFRVTETYEYNDYKQVRKIRREAGNGEAVIKEYTYPTDYANYMDYHQMVLDHVISPIVEYKETFDAGNGAYRQRYEKYDYKKYGSTYRPQKCTVAVRGAAELRKEYEYDKSGRLIAVTEDGAETTVYVWGYNGQHIIAEIKGVTLYEVETFVGDFDEFASSETPDFAVIEKIRQTYPGCVTSYTYSPFYGMTSKTDSRGSSEYYRYDTFGRLLYTVDNDGNVIKVFDYGYKNR